MSERRRRGCLGIQLRWWLPALYFAFAIYAWIDFTRINHDGLANVGLFLATLPVTLIVLLVGTATGRSSMWMPEGHGYLGDHALYYFPAVLMTTALAWLAGRAIDRFVARLPSR